MEEIMESNYYDILGVRSSASTEEIKEAFKLKEGQVDPERNPNVRNAAERYQALTEAYEVLIDPDRRHAYDQNEGYNQLRENLVDPTEAFKDYIGQLIIRSDAISSGQVEANLLDLDDKLKSVQKEREEELAGKLRAFLDQYIHGDTDIFKQQAMSEAKRMSGSAYEVELLHMIGEIYSSQAAQELGKKAIWLGVPFLIAWVCNKLHYRKSLNIIAEEVFPIVKTREEIRLLKKKDHAESSHAKKESEISLEKDDQTLAARKLWKLNAADIQVTLVHVCQMVLHYSDVTKEELNDRAMGLRILGKIFKKQESGEIVVETDDISSSSEEEFPCITNQCTTRILECLCKPRSRIDLDDHKTEELPDTTDNDTSYNNLFAAIAEFENQHHHHHHITI